jgi:hypothetical protein
VIMTVSARATEPKANITKAAATMRNDLRIILSTPPD